MSALLTSAKESLGALADLLLPRTCLACGRRLDVHEKQLCIYCKADLPYTYYWTRPHNPMADRLNECIQRHLSEKTTEAADTAEPYAYAAALFFYKSGSGYREITKALKYHGNTVAGRYFASILASRLSESEQFSDVDLVVPVPLHWTRQWQRGYNQAAVIAKVVADGLKHAEMEPRLLRRGRRTKTQTKLNIDEKSRNVSGAFQVRKQPEFYPRHILLIDDVFTTGATLSECHRALREVYGPEVRISVATLACVGA